MRNVAMCGLSTFLLVATKVHPQEPPVTFCPDNSEAECAIILVQDGGLGTNLKVLFNTYQNNMAMEGINLVKDYSPSGRYEVINDSQWEGNIIVVQYVGSREAEDSGTMLLHGVDVLRVIDLSDAREQSK